LLLADAEGLDLDAVIPVFHSWIQGQVFDEVLLDVTDYRHVHHGPGIVLIGHEADYSLDNTDGRLGIRYNRKAVLLRTNQDRLRQATAAALSAALRLEEDAAINQKLRFNGRDIQIWINDRALAPNVEQTRTAVDTDLRTFFDKLYGTEQYSLHPNDDSRRLPGAIATASREFSVNELLGVLQSPDWGS
jgi:hypothetical protein